MGSLGSQRVAPRHGVGRGMILSSGDVFLCAEVTEMLCLDGRENGHHLSSGGLE